VADEVRALRPDYAALLITADGLRPGPSDEASETVLAAAEQRAARHLAGSRPEDLPQVAQWREAFRAFGAKPQRTRPSVEALLRRLETGLPRVDRITDVYNAVSIAFLLPVGGEDLAHYAGPARLVRAGGSEDFDTFAAGQPVTEHPGPGEVIWRDDRGVTCRRWNWRQCARTRITAATTTAVFGPRRAGRARHRRAARRRGRTHRIARPAQPSGPVRLPADGPRRDVSSAAMRPGPGRWIPLTPLARWLGVS
jgi:DNA/RNA-binding domain of Phe-tRNA-synthetase-like protein